MIIAIMGKSGAGKSTMEYRLQSIGYEKIISTTTRWMRYNEEDNVDYYFTDAPTFEQKIRKGEMLEWELYSQDRYYGIAIDDIPKHKDSVVVVTPNGYRALKKLYGDNVIGVYLTASLGRRMIRYIERCGVDTFSFDDKNEIAARVERDYGMFLGIEKEVDFVVDANGDAYNTLGNILEKLRKRGIRKYGMAKKDISL